MDIPTRNLTRTNPPNRQLATDENPTLNLANASRRLIGLEPGPRPRRLLHHRPLLVPGRLHLPLCQEVLLDKRRGLRPEADPQPAVFVDVLPWLQVRHALKRRTGLGRGVTLGGGEDR